MCKVKEAFTISINSEPTGKSCLAKESILGYLNEDKIQN